MAASKPFAALTLAAIAAGLWARLAKSGVGLSPVLDTISGGDPLGLGLALSSAASVGIAAAVLRRGSRRRRGSLN